MGRFKPAESPYRSESLQCFIDDVSDFRWIVARTTPQARAKFVYVQEAGAFCGYEGCYTRRHGLASYLLKVTTAGEGLLRYDGVDYRVPVGSFFWIDCQKPQYYVTAPDAACWAMACLHFHGSVSKPYYDSFMAQNSYSPVGTLADPEAAVGLITQMTDIYAGACYDFATDVRAAAIITALLTACLSSALVSCESESHDVPPFLQKVHSYIFEHYTERITLDGLAARFLVNKFYLQKQFRQLFGYTTVEYQNLLRVAKAKELLRKTNMSVSDLSYFLGLESASYFIQMFKKAEGTTPHQYRMEWKNPF